MNNFNSMIRGSKNHNFSRSEYSYHFLSSLMAEIRDRSTGKAVWLGERKHLDPTPAVIFIK